MSSERGIISDIELRSPRGRLLYGSMLLLLSLLGIVFIFPLIYAFSAGLKQSAEIYRPGLSLLPQTPQWQNYSEAWQRLRMLGMFKSSLLIALGGTIGQLAVASLAAYSLARLNPVGKRILMTIFLMTLAVPGIAYIIPLYITLVDLPIIHVSLLNSYWGLWLPYAANAFAILIFKHFFEQIPPEIYDAAAIDGASPLQIFYSITLPLSRSILLILGIRTFIGLWQDFMLPMLVMREPSLQPVTVRLYTLVQQFPLNLQLAAAFLAMLPPLLAAVCIQRWIRAGLLMGSVKG